MATEPSSLFSSIQGRGGAYRRSGSVSSAPGGYSTPSRDAAWEQTKEALAGGVKAGFGWLTALAAGGEREKPRRGNGARREASNPLRERLQKRGGLSAQGHRQQDASGGPEPEPFADSMEMEAQRRFERLSIDATAGYPSRPTQPSASTSAERQPGNETSKLQADGIDPSSVAGAAEREPINRSEPQVSPSAADPAKIANSTPAALLGQNGPTSLTQRSRWPVGSSSRSESQPQQPTHKRATEPAIDTEAVRAKREFWLKKARESSDTTSCHKKLTREEAQQKLQVLARATKTDFDEVRRIRQLVRELDDHDDEIGNA